MHIHKYNTILFYIRHIVHKYIEASERIEEKHFDCDYNTHRKNGVLVTLENAQQRPDAIRPFALGDGIKYHGSHPHIDHAQSGKIEPVGVSKNGW